MGLMISFQLTALLLVLGSALVVDAAGTYIVTLKPNANLDAHVTQRREGVELKCTYGSVLNGYAAVLSPSALEALRAANEVQSIESDQTFSTQGKAKGFLDFDHSPPARLAKKAAVDIYFLDTGINTAQPCFGGRAVWGATFGGYQNVDGNGHGTAQAASALCSSAGGTATAAHGIAVKVIADSGSGATSDIISGINWIASQYESTGKPSIGALAVAGATSAALRAVISSAVAKGVHMVVIAVYNGSPVQTSTAVLVGPLARSKAWTTGSPSGAGIDVWSFYPTTCPTGLSGCTASSNSVSYVSSYLAVAIGSYGNQAPAALAQDLLSHAVSDVTGAPSGTTWVAHIA